MRILKQACLSLFLLVLALMGINMLRFNLAPAQVRPQGEGQGITRNGDTNCDGKIDISDPIFVINWLFFSGPEPCAIAQTDTCCEELRTEVAALRSTVTALAARTPGPNDMVTIKSKVSFQGSETKIIMEVPEGKRFVVTSISWHAGVEAKLVSVLNGQVTEIPKLDVDDFNWTSGFAFPSGSNVGLRLGRPDQLTGDLFLNGYLTGE